MNLQENGMHRRTLRWISNAVLSFLLMALAACSAQSAANASREARVINVSGSTSVSPFAEHLAELYQKQHAGLSVNVQSLGSTAGIQAAIQGVAEIGMSSRELKKDEAEKLDELVIARDALAVVVHPSNPITNLTQAQVQGIFSGTLTNWAEVGGANKAIVLVVREAGSGTAGAFDELVMKGIHITPNALRQGSNGAIRQVVSDDPNAIGYISLGIVDSTVKAVAINNVAPSVEHVLAKTYKFVRPFLFVWPKGSQLNNLAQSYVDYVMSNEAQAELQKLGLVPGEQ
jgi:phosphate transport system substrate-binding protein